MAGQSRSPDWSSLPCDPLTAVLRLLDAPSALAFAGVCVAWSAAAATFAGVPLARTPWLFSWDDAEEEGDAEEDYMEQGPTRATLRCLLGAGNASFPTAPFPGGRSLRCCGACHGWIVASDERSNLVLYDPFAPPSAANLIPLPPVPDFESWGTRSIYGCYYQKVILSTAPSHATADGAAYTAALIHCDGCALSFAKAGDAEWRLAWTMSDKEIREIRHGFWKDGKHMTVKTKAADVYSDIVYHGGRFYAVTEHGTVESWDLSGPNTEPVRELIGTTLGFSGDEIVLSRHLVSTPWGDLLHVRVLSVQNLQKYPQGVRVRIGKIIPTGHRMVELPPPKALQGHAMFLGRNHSALVHPDEFPGLNSDCVYFTSPPDEEDMRPWIYGWRGVKIYDLKNNKAEDAFANFHGQDPGTPPAIWIIRNRKCAHMN